MMKKVLGTVTVLALSVSSAWPVAAARRHPQCLLLQALRQRALQALLFPKRHPQRRMKTKAAAAQLLNDLTGSYQELWPVILADEYKQTWLDDCTALVGEENAEAAFEKLSSMVTSDVYGEDAVEAYANGGGAYFCGFTNSLATLTFDGETSTISGTIRTAMCWFSHTYHYIGMEPVHGLYEFESDDADSGEFTYFFLAPDTSAETYHIEFRYGSDAEALSQYDAGEYAYWVASGISTDCDQTMIDNCIELFCTENLAG